MNNALIGHSGFIGETLKKQTQFSALYRSTNISEISGKSFDKIVCAGAPAKKWLANKEPLADKKNIQVLIDLLSTVTTDFFVLVSTVDVFRSPMNVNEDSILDTNDLHPYGLHRLELENFVREHFKNHLIVRLPGLVGPGLKKNIIFDFHNDNNINKIESRSIFQFYPTVNLSYDIDIAAANNLGLVHLTAEPISVGEICKQALGRDFENHVMDAPPSYNMTSKYGKLFGGAEGYQYTKKESISSIRAYFQSEPHTEIG